MLFYIFFNFTFVDRFPRGSRGRFSGLFYHLLSFGSVSYEACMSKNIGYYLQTTSDYVMLISQWMSCVCQTIVSLCRRGLDLW